MGKCTNKPDDANSSRAGMQDSLSPIEISFKFMS